MVRIFYALETLDIIALFAYCLFGQMFFLLKMHWNYYESLWKSSNDSFSVLLLYFEQTTASFFFRQRTWEKHPLQKCEIVANYLSCSSMAKKQQFIDTSTCSKCSVAINAFCYRFYFSMDRLNTFSFVLTPPLWNCVFASTEMSVCICLTWPRTQCTLNTVHDTHSF